MMTTQWDDERVLGRVEARTDDGRSGQKEIGNAQGYVVRLYDRGPLDGRLDEPALIFDSAVAYGGVGIFGSEDEAQEYKGRCVAAELSRRRQGEQLVRERRDQLPRLATECIKEHDKAKEEAKAANKRATDWRDRQNALTKEADHPTVIVECHPRGEGWTVKAAPCVTEGEEGEPRTLAEVVPEPTKPKRKASKRTAKGKKEVSSPSIEDALDRTLASKPTSVPDCKGLPISIGAKVLHVADEFEAELEDIRYQEKSGDWLVTIVDGVGQPFECLSTELERVEVTAEEPEPDDGEPWP